MVVSRALLDWLVLQLSYLGMLKTLFSTECLDALPVLALFLWIIAIVVFPFKIGHSNRIEQSLSFDILQVEANIVEESMKAVEITESKPTVHSKDRSKKDHRFNLRLAMTMMLAIPCALLLLGHTRLISALHGGRWAPKRSTLEASSSTGLQEVFEVYQPVSLTSHGSHGSHGCNVDMVLMDHVFAYSYGTPFVGIYEPPSCEFDTVRINFTVSSRGVQYDRLALMYLGDTEVFRTSTAEPTSTGIVWTYVKEMSQYNALWKNKQKLIFDLGNIVNSEYTGDYNTTLKAHFSYEGNVKTADYILPISSKGSASNSSSSFTVPTDNTTVKYTIPDTVSRAIVAISACGQSEEEFWWSNVFSQDEEDFSNTIGELYGYSPFREIQLYIDGMLAGFVWPFPVIFTGGVAPGFWHPIVGIDAFDLRMPEIDISPFLPLLQDGEEHSFEIRVTGLTVSADGTVTLADTIGSYWVVTGNIFLFTEGKEDSKELVARGSAIPFTATRNLVQGESENNTLSYSIVAERTFSASSDKFSWTQKLSFSNYGYLNQQGYSQVNKQLTSGVSTLTELGDKLGSYETTFNYPLLVNATYGITAGSLIIDSWMKRGLDIEASGGPGISTYTFASGPSELHTTQSGQAQYKSTTNGTTSWGDTADEFHSTGNGESYSRSVRAVGGDVVYDTKSAAKSVSSSHGTDATGRQTVREMLGRGPGKPRS
ncbi:hypothetical protein N7526_003037 [Penicillium atrosanguineum]|nr:hypothetical protein N7526_003037 [Penicillium atrosanguineum]